MPWLFMILLVISPGISQAKKVTLSWDASPTSSVTGYVILTSVHSDMDNPSEVDVGDTLSHILVGLEDQGNHYFCVKAYDDSNTSACSNIVNSPPIVLPDKIQHFRFRLE